MSHTDIKALLAELHAELARADTVDEETRVLVAELDADLERLLHPEAEEPDPESSIDLARALESQFEASHPVAARFVQEIVAALAKMGI